MSYTLGVDIGTFETKGVLVDAAGGGYRNGASSA